MTNKSKKPESNTSAGQITRREFTNRAAALGVSTAFATTIGGAAGVLSESAKAAMTPKKGGHLRVGMAQGNTSDTLRGGPQ